MKSSKKRICLYSSLVTAVLVVSLITVFIQNSGVGPHASIVLAAGTPDALDNQIYTIAFVQNTTGSWSTVASLYSSSFVPNYNLTIPANQHTIVTAHVLLNVSLAPDAATAQTRARVYLNIPGVVTNASMVVIGAVSVSSYWHVYFAYPSSYQAPTTTWIPAIDAVYTMSFYYQAYY